MTREELWQTHWTEIKTFMDEAQRNPSRHRKEDMKMVNWLKANRKARNAGKMPAERAEKFEQLIERMELLYRKNQYSLPVAKILGLSKLQLFSDNGSQD